MSPKKAADASSSSSSSATAAVGWVDATNAKWEEAEEEHVDLELGDDELDGDELGSNDRTSTNNVVPSMNQYITAASRHQSAPGTLMTWWK